MHPWFDAYEIKNPEAIENQCFRESKWRDSNPRPFGPEFEENLCGA